MVTREEARARAIECLQTATRELTLAKRFQEGQCLSEIHKRRAKRWEDLAMYWLKKVSRQKEKKGVNYE